MDLVFLHLARLECIAVSWELAARKRIKIRPAVLYLLAAASERERQPRRPWRAMVACRQRAAT